MTTRMWRIIINHSLQVISPAPQKLWLDVRPTGAICWGLVAAFDGDGVHDATWNPQEKSDGFLVRDDLVRCLFIISTMFFEEKCTVKLLRCTFEMILWLMAAILHQIDLILRLWYVYWILLTLETWKTLAIKISPEQWTKGPFLFRVFFGDEILPRQFGDYTVKNHYISILSLNNQYLMECIQPGFLNVAHLWTVPPLGCGLTGGTSSNCWSSAMIWRTSLKEWPSWFLGGVDFK